MTFRIFTNDRGKRGGMPMYSALSDVTLDARALERAVDFKAKRPMDAAGAKAIEWPPTTEESKVWLAKHVG